MDFLTHNLLPFFGIFLAVLVVHESGHYFTAKMFGVKVLEAGIGLPPKVWGFTWRGTEYTLNLLPFGAFVRMLGEEDPSDPQSLAAQPKWKRAIIIGSGAALNIILAVFLFMVGLMIPREIPAGGALIAGVVPDSPAQQADLRAGDEIIEVNGRSIANTGDAIYIVRLSQGSDVDFTIERKDPRGGPTETMTKTAYARWDPPEYIDECGIERGTGMTGIILSPAHAFNVPMLPEDRAKLEKASRDAYDDYTKQLPAGAAATCYSPIDFFFGPIDEARCAALDEDQQAAARALKQEAFPNAPAPCYEFDPGQLTEQPTKTVSDPLWEAAPKSVRIAMEHLILTRNQVWKLARGFDSAPLTGPVGIAQATGEIVEVAGWRYLIEFAATISMGLGILNFLPIPMVDGGRLMFIFIEFIRGGRRIAPQKEAMVHLIGFAVMIMLFLVIAYFDTARWIRGDSLLQ
jgi:regulator of sigma E protease